MNRALLVFAVFAVAGTAHASGGFADPNDDVLGMWSPTPHDPDKFVAGQLGVVTSSLWPRWRAVAYRVLAGAPLQPETAEALGGGSPPSTTATAKPADKQPTPVQAWLTARAAIATPDPSDAARLPNAQYGYDYNNCYADAFSTATATLQKRIAKFGAKSKEVGEWLHAQDIVFGNCDSDPNKYAVPVDKVPTGIAPAIQKDRDYQVGAALFYGRKHAEARVVFAKIADDKSSEWSGYGRFVLARAMIRQGAPYDESNSPPNDNALLGEAEKLLERVLADPKASALHASARRLIRFIAFRTRPDKQLRALGEILTRGQGDDLDLVLTDFAWLADKLPSPIALATVTAQKDDELTEWTLAWQLEESASAEYALGRYREKHALPWLVLALSSIAPTHAEAKALLEASRQVKPSSPAYLTVAYHRARLLIGQDRVPAARALIDELLAKKDLPGSVKNALLDMRYGIARTLAEAATLMLRATSTSDERLSPESLALFLHYVPIAETIKAATDPKIALPGELQRDALRAAFWRAALLDDVPLAKAALDGFKATAAPGKPSDKPTDFGPWINATTPAQRRYELVHLALHDLQMSINTDGESTCGQVPPATGKAAPAFIDAALQKKAAAESHKLEVLFHNDDLSTFLANQIADTAATHKADPRLPEDLHLAVLGTKHACGSGATAASKRAWKALHSLFPKDEWTKQTKYWYP